MLILLLSCHRICFPGKARRTGSVFQENTWHISLQDTLHRTAKSLRKLAMAPGDTVLRWAQWCRVNGCTQSQSSKLNNLMILQCSQKCTWMDSRQWQEVWICSLMNRFLTYSSITGLWHSGEEKNVDLKSLRLRRTQQQGLLLLGLIS